MRRLLPMAGLMASLGCGAPPVVSVLVAEAQGVPRVEALARLELLVGTCGGEPEAQELPISPGARPRVELPIPPGEPFFVWLRGYAAEGDQDPVAEACSTWTRATANVQLTLRLGPAAGLCPPDAPNPPVCP